jgi:thiol-disulfide isomerase/thioredoxin
MIVLEKFKKYSFFIWLLAGVLIVVGANKLYRNYAARQIIKDSFGSKPELKDSTKNNADKKNSETKPTKNAKGMPLVPDFTLKDEQGKEISLSDYSGKVVILNFWASWCPPCKAEMPEFNKMNNELKDSKDIVLLTINLTDGQRETKEKAVKFLKDNKYSLTALFDVQGTVADIFGIQSIPTTVVIDRDGYLHDYIMGATTKNTVLKSANEVK